MPDYHILGKSLDRRHADVYVHLPIPATQTVAGASLDTPDATLTYQRALKEHLAHTGQAVTVLPNHATDHATENAALVAGEVVEVFVHFRFDALDLTNSQRRTQIETGNGNHPGGVTQMKLDIVDSTSDLYKSIIEPLEWWGYYHNTP